MCGIIGGSVADDKIKQILLGGLARMEYRGYDSAGIAVCGSSGRVQTQVAVGRVAALRRACVQLPDGCIGIGHTRWATHGAPTPANAHPIRAGKDGQVWVVHNGIIENHRALKEELQAAGCTFASETDTEVIAYLLERALTTAATTKTKAKTKAKAQAKQNAAEALAAAVRAVLPQLEGAYAFVAMTADGTLACVRQGTPLLAAQRADGGVLLASDPQAVAGLATAVHYFDSGDYAVLCNNKLQIWNANGASVKPQWTPAQLAPATATLGEYRHFMRKEIADQPDAVAATMERWLPLPEARTLSALLGADANTALRQTRQIGIVACGTSYHAGLVARHWLARLGVPCRVEIASEYRYAPDPQAARSLVIAISQSGETADTLAAVRHAKDGGAKTLGIVNVENSTLARECDFVFYTQAGVEVGVASTKAFTAQMVALLLLSWRIAAARGCDGDEIAQACASLRRLPNLLHKILLLEDAIKDWARQLVTCKSALYIGRRMHYPIALEGALKLKEISYIHAEGIAAGELKHGSLALVDVELPVIGLAPADGLQQKIIANLSEVRARGGRLFVLGGCAAQTAGLDAQHICIAEDGGEWLSPIVYTLPLQLLAYHTACHKGTDVDKPRNLAKSVTVE